MKEFWLLLAILCFTLCKTASVNDVIITEIMYNHPLDDELEYIELYNPTTFGILLQDWKFSQGIDFTFPANSRIAASDYIVVVKNTTRFSHFYDWVAPNKVFGGYSSTLSNSGEMLTIQDATGKKIFSLTYDVELPWPPTADGWGSSIEMICIEHNPSDPRNWQGSLLPEVYEPALNLSGTPAAENHWMGCPLVTEDQELFPHIIISEIMYSIVGETTFVEHHEYIGSVFIILIHFLFSKLIFLFQNYKILRVILLILAVGCSYLSKGSSLDLLQAPKLKLIASLFWQKTPLLSLNCIQM